MNKPITLLFFIFSSVFVFSTLLPPYPLSWLVKLLPMILLISIAIQQKVQGNFHGNFANIVITGLVFSALGDVILDVDGINLFIFGLGSFFFAHVCYLFSLKPFENKRLSLIVGYLIYGVAIFLLLSGSLGALFIPVLGYMSVLLFMAMATIVSKKSNKWLLLGGMSFVISDSLLGIDKFYFTIPYSGLAIMSSYYFAQYALLQGFLNAEKA